MSAQALSCLSSLRELSSLISIVCGSPSDVRWVRLQARESQASSWLLLAP
jgi:hypothetical protein